MIPEVLNVALFFAWGLVPNVEKCYFYAHGCHSKVWVFWVFSCVCLTVGMLGWSKLLRPEALTSTCMRRELASSIWLLVAVLVSPPPPMLLPEAPMPDPASSRMSPRFIPGRIRSSSLSAESLKALVPKLARISRLFLRLKRMTRPPNRRTESGSDGSGEKKRDFRTRQKKYMTTH